MLRAVAEQGTTVLAVCSEPPAEGAVVVRTEQKPAGGGRKARKDDADGADGADGAGAADGADDEEKEGADDALAEASRA